MLTYWSSYSRVAIDCFFIPNAIFNYIFTDSWVIGCYNAWVCYNTWVCYNVLVCYNTWVCYMLVYLDYEFEDDTDKGKTSLNMITK